MVLRPMRYRIDVSEREAPDTNRPRSLRIPDNAPRRFVSYLWPAHRQLPDCGYNDSSEWFCAEIKPSRILP